MASTRIGVLVPAGNSIHEREFEALRAATDRELNFAFRPFEYPAAGVADFCSALFGPSAQIGPKAEEVNRWGRVGPNVKI